jgi:hypothetical protein
MRDEIAQLTKALEPSFTAREDAELAATMMVMALRYELGQPATEADQLRYRAALERLPKGSTATPRVVFVSPLRPKDRSALARDVHRWPDALRKLTALWLGG